MARGAQKNFWRRLADVHSRLVGTVGGDGPSPPAPSEPSVATKTHLPGTRYRLISDHRVGPRTPQVFLGLCWTPRGGRKAMESFPSNFPRGSDPLGRVLTIRDLAGALLTAGRTREEGWGAPGLPPRGARRKKVGERQARGAPLGPAPQTRPGTCERPPPTGTLPAASRQADPAAAHIQVPAKSTQLPRSRVCPVAAWPVHAP